MTFQLVCPKCLRTVRVLTANVTASCTHGRRAGVTNRPVAMVPIDQLTEQKANA